MRYGGWQHSALVPFCERLRNRRIVAFGTPCEAICPTASDGDMAVIRPDDIPTSASFPSKSDNLSYAPDNQLQRGGGSYVNSNREETTRLSIRKPHLRPLMALGQRFRSCTGASV